jgi:hypothetical protein
MSSPQDDLAVIRRARSPIYTRGTSPTTEWDEHCNARAFISQIREVRHQIVVEWPNAVERANWFQSGPYDNLLPLLDKAEALLRDDMCSYAYREVWEWRWTETAQFWGSVNLRRVGKRVCDVVELLRECEAQAARLGRLTDEIRSELPVWCKTIVVGVRFEV